MKAAMINGRWYFVNTNTGRHVLCHNRASAQALVREAQKGIRPLGNGKEDNPRKGAQRTPIVLSGRFSPCESERN
jgi:hypothetical protein